MEQYLYLSQNKGTLKGEFLNCSEYNHIKYLSYTEWQGRVNNPMYFTVYIHVGVVYILN